jgi:predicted DNA-binding protein
MPLRAIRVPDETWKLAQERAKAEGTTVSAVIREALELYGEGTED